MKRSLAVVLVCLCATALGAQQPLPPPFPRANATQLMENDRIRVWDIVWPKGQPTALHRHVYDQVGTYYAPGGRLITSPDGAGRSGFTEAGSCSSLATVAVVTGEVTMPARAMASADRASGAAGATGAGDVTERSAGTSTPLPCAVWAAGAG